MKLKIHTKLLVYILTTSIIIYAFSLGYISYKINTVYYDNAQSYANEVARSSAEKIVSNIDGSMKSLRAVSYSLLQTRYFPENKKQEFYYKFSKKYLEDNLNYTAVAWMWELEAIDSSYHKPYGRRRYIYTYKDGKVNAMIEDKDMDGDDYGGLYYSIKTNKKEELSEPYYFQYEGESEKILEISLIIPFLEEGKFLGLANIDVDLTEFSTMVEKIQPFENSFSALISNEGMISGYKNPKLLNKSIFELFKNTDVPIIQNIQQGRSFNFYTVDSLGTEYYVNFLPLNIGKSESPWSFCMAVPVDVMTKEADKDLRISLIVVIIGLIILLIVIWIISREISRPLVDTTKVLQRLAQGEFNEKYKVKITTQDEIGDIRKSVNSLIDGLTNSVNFAEQIGKDNLEADFKPLSEKDELGLSLIRMRNSLIQAKKEEQKRKEEDQKQTWATEGEARFGDILRQYNNNMEDFTFNIISNLVKYIDASQGGIFVINDDDKNNIFLELTSSYAFNRRKILEKKVDIGIGLIGRCYQEGETIFMKNIPDGYINITSGLGEKTPENLLIVPFKFNEEIYAIAEIASFKEIEPYKIDFVETVGQSIASTIATVKINIRTNRLLEELKVQSEELASQEEEMRQNMEEMQTTQEELSKNMIYYENIVNAFYETVMIIEYDTDGRVTEVNNKALQFLKKTKNELIGEYQGRFAINYEQISEFDQFWEKLKNGEAKHLNQSVRIENIDYIVSEFYIPIKNHNEEVTKILNILINVEEK